MKKISFFSSLPPFRGGISHFSQLLCKSLELKTELKTFTFKKQYPSFLFPGKSQFINNKSTIELKAKRIVSTFNPFSYFKAARIIKGDVPQVFICNYWMSFFGPMLGFISRSLPSTVIKVAIIHNLTPHEKRFFDKSFNRYFLKSFDGFIALSDFVLQDIKSMNKDKPAIVISHPAYTNFNDPIDCFEARNLLQIDSDKKTILFFGIIRDYKGLDLLIDAFKYLDDSYQLLIVGEVYGKDTKYKNQIDSNSNKNRIYFINKYIPDEDVHLYFSSADCLSLPYRSGTQSGVAAIAHKFALPVITTAVGGISEKIDDGVNGLIINELSAQCIAEKIKICTALSLKDKLLINHKMNKGNELNQWDLFADKTLNFIDSLKKSN